ncbi:hypothetical protein [Sphingomonas sp. KR3-1]|uniref:hypothetical protein n=1 Tax=Sphingomonas sp. KR3-1 TaxID=3156611 RepID=UPI0032B31208
MIRGVSLLIALSGAALVATTAPAHAQMFSSEAISVTGDARIVAADGETSWLEGGLGKTRFDGTDSRELQAEPRLAEADLIWQPRFSWALSGTVVAIAQQGQEHAVDLSEAVVTFKPMVSGPAKLSVRAGLYWPAISLEHSGAAWVVTDTITPSAVNSWVGEEIKTGGVEATVTAPIGGQRIAATFGMFGLNDTSGTLLAFRGWALHDEKATAFGTQPLPPLSGMAAAVQAPATRPMIEIDNRPGWYAKLGWSPTSSLELQAFHYDNRGDPEAVTDTLQWGWRTRFDNLGAVFTAGPLTLKAQAMGGRTEMGFPMAGRIWVDTKFRAAYLLETWRFARGSVSARLDAFGTRGRGSMLGALSAEDGWAVTLAARREIGRHLSLLAELLHVDSRRDYRAALGLAARQRQNQFQLALRVHL